MVRDKETMKIISLILYCDTCQCDTKHVLTASGREFVCSCGTAQEYHLNEKAKQ